MKVMIILLMFISCCCLGGTASSSYVQSGKASYYGDKFHGKKTASGEVFNKWDYTCAHKKLPFGTKLKVTNLKNKKSVIVKVNDRGPFVKGRIIDLSYAAAKKIDMIKDGVIKVKIEKVR
ncbi:septal ring lytic transglycosylase RlpA family protein [candidate division WOR-3 bacterium]|nr:septal ring lytic transglycosylase RlpA family protein [candidate division WOR-3 bacterium]